MALAPPSPSVRSIGDPLERMVSSASQTSLARNSNPKPESTKQPSPARLPPPTLFQGPPSRNASNISLHHPGAVAAAVGLPSSASASPTSSDRLQRMPSRRPRPDANNSDPYPSEAGVKGRPASTLPPRTTDVNARREDDRADALWAEMQNTLAEVEVSAANGSHIFGAGHAKALEELRKAQLALAQSWAKSEVDEVESHAARDDAEDAEPMSAGAGGVAGKEKDRKNGAKQQQQQQQQQEEQRRPGSAGNNGNENERKKTLEEETENDVLLARTRREANDRYFEQVNNSVLDAVKKLDEVAEAMRKVAMESRDIWSEDGDGDGSDSVTGSTTGG